ncbi:MAG: N-acetylneuraminate synthase family protein [Verrucomicrobiota bacterium]|nr:N-acetylneuraminate synthase family protein [Verrucomicrobiota bacterium]
MNTYNFNDLFVFDLANNHQGSIDHARRIVKEIGEVVAANQVRGVFKFQFRQLETFVHPAHKENSKNKHIPRFLATRLVKNDFSQLAEDVRKAGLITMSTPFDEGSVHDVVELGIEIVKVASCSATDWPLLETIAECNKPVIFSTGGLTFQQIDDLVSFFDHRRVEFAIMHCVSIYPTPDEHLELNQIDQIKRRYRDKVVGYSTHEVPADTTPVIAAVAKGALILERHVGIETEKTKLNAYSSTPSQIDAWIKAAIKAKTMCGHDKRPEALLEERESLDSLKRGVYVRKNLKKGVEIESDDVYFAMPLMPGQVTSGEWRKGISLNADVEKDGALIRSAVSLPDHPTRKILYTAVHTIKAMLNEARIAVGTDFSVEFSHHYGIEKFTEIGAILIDCVNREYCKKLVIQIPGQRHPNHFHKRKEETFQVLYGVLELDLEGKHRKLYPGDTILVPQGVWHSFWSGSDAGVIFEEISTTHFNNDSFYEDKNINKIDRSERKTKVSQWGRYQL